MSVRTFSFAAFAIVSAIGSANAGERIDFTPPLYREQVRTTAAVRPATEITTTPTLVQASSEGARRIVEATAR